MSGLAERSIDEDHIVNSIVVPRERDCISICLCTRIVVGSVRGIEQKELHKALRNAVREERGNL